MPQISSKKRDKIIEQVLYYLFVSSPDSKFTSEISNEIIRDEEFTKSILLDLQKRKLIVSIDKNKEGETYLRRRRWRLSSEAYEFYNKKQINQSTNKLSSQTSQDLD